MYNPVQFGVAEANALPDISSAYPNTGRLAVPATTAARASKRILVIKGPEKPAAKQASFLSQL
jgi:hypothetical protein